MRTEPLFREQPYLASTEASILGINDRGGIILDRTIFYATSGGQPGDTGHLLRSDGSKIAIAATVTGETKDDIIHLPAAGEAMPEVGEAVRLAIDWERRYKLMRMHTACHLLSVICPFPITGASVDEADSRVDFDLPETGWTKEEATKRLMELVEADHPVYTRWISEEELAANPTLVKSKNVRPPAGAGRIRLVCIGENSSVDSQPCGGTHVERTGEVGEIHIGKIEKKGRENRRFRIRFGRCRPADPRLFALARALSLLSMISSYPSRVGAEALAKQRSDACMSEKSPFIVSADWLQERLGEPGLSIVDASWYFPGRDARAEYDAAHIPGAVFFDQDLVVEPDSDLPHTLPDPLTFERYASSMGISRDDTIVVYDGPGLFSAPRVWWMFRVMGADKVLVLDGGFERWRTEGRPVTSETTRIAPTAFVTQFDKSRVVSLAEMRRIVESGEAQIADARSAGRFSGTEPEPRPGLRSGHMPGAVSVPAPALSENGNLLPLDRLRERLESAGLDLDRPVVTSCGSGVTAAIITLALESLGHKDNRLYDGSWSEWGKYEDTPVATGPR